MSIFKWKGPETSLSRNSIVATGFTIEKIKDFGKEMKYAEGTIIIKDYIEHGIQSINKWEAKGLRDEKGHLCWIVDRKEEKNSIFFDEITGKTLFTLILYVNYTIKKFIAEMLNKYLDGKVEPELQKYIGEKEKYKGPCICRKISSSNEKNPFPWREITQGGKFPEHCFTCSCGRNWFCWYPKENLWAEVKDKKAWEMLTLYNGVVAQKLGILEGAFYLLQTLRDAGYISLSS